MGSLAEIDGVMYGALCGNCLLYTSQLGQIPADVQNQGFFLRLTTQGFFQFGGLLIAAAEGEGHLDRKSVV